MGIRQRDPARITNWIGVEDATGMTIRDPTRNTRARPPLDASTTGMTNRDPPRIRKINGAPLSMTGIVIRAPHRSRKMLPMCYAIEMDPVPAATVGMTGDAIVRGETLMNWKWLVPVKLTAVPPALPVANWNVT